MQLLVTKESGIAILRSLAMRYLEICNNSEQNSRRDLWRRHNGLERTRPPIYVRAIPWIEVPEVHRLECKDGFLRGYEQWLRMMIFRSAIDDDYIYEPWITVEAVKMAPPGGIWGLEVKEICGEGPRGAVKYDAPIKNLSDKDKLIFPHHAVDEEATACNHARLNDAIGDILPVIVDRAPFYRVWGGDIITQLAYLRGLEQVMWDMVDNPEWLHELLTFMRDGILTVQEEAEASGDWRLYNHENQAMPYATELADPSTDPVPVMRSQLWYFCAAQELTLVSPRMHDEFMLQYQLPIIEKFGLVAYGCCEDLTEKIDMLRQIPNLRRIAIAPRADVRRCAEQVGADYVMSYRPNPAEMVCCGFDPDHVRRTLRNALDECIGCHVDITLKDVETVEGCPERLIEWARIAKEVACG
ncbi:MAG: uroporphyrinogen decarboxylase/cobalamine-independent methonine synthase family protein [Armatimonadota bacterium]